MDDEMTSNEGDRVAYLAGEGAGSLSDQEQAELDGLGDLLSNSALWEEPDPALEDRVVATIADQARRTPARERAPREQPRPRLWGRRPRLVLGGAVAAATAAVLVALAVQGGSPSPLQFSMAVSGTALAPHARGSATLTKTASGWRIALSASGLPHLSDGRYYEAWLKNRAGTLVPVGTFNDARAVTLWAGVPPTEFPALTVTRQQANGISKSSGERVLTGTIRTTH